MISGYKKSDFESVLKPGGNIVSIEMDYEENADALTQITKLVEEGKIKPVIDRSYPLEEMVEAHRYVEAGHKKGNVVMTVA